MLGSTRSKPLSFFGTNRLRWSGQLQVSRMPDTRMPKYPLKWTPIFWSGSHLNKNCVLSSRRTLYFHPVQPQPTQTTCPDCNCYLSLTLSYPLCYSISTVCKSTDCFSKVTLSLSFHGSLSSKLGSFPDDRHKVEKFHFLWNSSTISGTASQKCGTALQKVEQVLKAGNCSTNCGTGTINGDESHKWHAISRCWT